MQVSWAGTNLLRAACIPAFFLAARYLLYPLPHQVDSPADLITQHMLCVSLCVCAHMCKHTVDCGEVLCSGCDSTSGLRWV